MTTALLADEILRRAGNARRFIVGIAGPPGAGKSTLAETLRDELDGRGEAAEVLPMDGFHMDNGILEQRGLLARKGAPETFDVRGFLDIVKAVRDSEQEVLVPVFDRSREIAIASARAISPQTRIVLAEGNYLLLNEAPWSRLAGCFDFTILLAPPLAVLEERLLSRWRNLGLPEADVLGKVGGNDLPNALRVLENSVGADIVTGSENASDLQAAHF